MELLNQVSRFLDEVENLYGDGDLAGPPSLEFMRGVGLPSISGEGATPDAANATNAALCNRLERLCDKDDHVRRLMTRACDSIECGRKVVAEERQAFKSVAGLGGVADSPLGLLSVLPVLAGIVARVTGQVQGDFGQMGDLGQEMYGDADSDRESVFLASNSQRSGALGPVFDFLESVSGLPYLWGGFSPANGFDCSGLVSAVANMLAGLDPLAERTSTSGMGPFLAARGARRGPGGVGTVEVGWKDGPQYPGGGHTAGTVHLANGSINFESSGNGVQFGGAASGARGFDNIMHFELA